MFDFKRVLGFIWAAPVTVVGLIYVALFTWAGWYQRLGQRGDALVWQFNVDKAPFWLNKEWLRWSGHALGNVVVLKYNPDTDRGRITLRHEEEHVRQCMILGFFFPILYFLSYMSIRLACPHSNPYVSNVFEMDARRSAGQVVDVEGTVKQLQARARSKHKPLSFD